MADPSSRRAPPVMEELFEALRARILADEWAAGARLPPERELADSYDTNRNTLREAIRRLEQAGLVTVRQGQGVTVANFRKTGSSELLAPFLLHGKDAREKAQLILDLLEPRLRVLEYGVERFVERCRPDDMAPLESAVSQARAAELRHDPDALIAAENAWYEAMVEAAHDQVVSWIARPILQINVEVLRRWPVLVVFEPSLAEYLSDLLTAVTARDPQRAVTAARKHYATIDATVRAMLEPLAAAPAPAAARAPDKGAEGPADKRRTEKPRPEKKRKGR